MALRSRAKGSFFRSVEPGAPSARRPDPATQAAVLPGRRRELARPRIETTLWFVAVAVAVLVAVLAVFAG